MTAPRPLIATYRLQLGPGFGFAEAERVVPYLASLGISHLYLSPIWQAAEGSTHGYDVVDHARVSSELGGMAGFLRLVESAHSAGLGIVLDIVPNHVGIQGGRHPWWRDVLRYGPSSPYAGHFDIDWEGQAQMRAGVVLLPTLGQQFGAALEAGELTLGIESHDIVVRYYDSTYPLAPRTYHQVLGIPSGPALEGASQERLSDLAESLDRLRDATPEFADVLRARVVDHLTSDPILKSWAERRFASLNGTPGDPGSFDRLDELMREQSYRLASWRVSGEEINYRRFFDINDLAAIRVEQPHVFNETHRLLKELVEAGLVDGLRVDHVDGLYDPIRYLERLNEIGSAGPAGRIPIWVEKILGHGEALPSWPVSGTTGYEFLGMVGGLQTSKQNSEAMTRAYDEFTGVVSDYGDVSFAARRRVADRTFSGEMTVLAHQLHRLAQRERRHRDNTLRSLHDGLAAMLSCFPVYRTYFENDEARPGDREMLLAVAQEARRREPDVTPESLAFITSTLLLESSNPGERTSEIHVRRRLQQVSGPVMAKGVEDTTFFRYHRLLAHNEVGSHPEHFGLGVEAAHRLLEERGRAWPEAMLASSTHDTKRSEDARARLLVLSEMPDAWLREARLWQRGNARWKRHVGGRAVPGPNTEYYIYQSIVASWDGAADVVYRDRIVEHMRKAMRESKVHTEWTNVNEEYEEGVLAFVRSVLDPRRSSRFIERVSRFVERISGAATVNSLAAVTLKCTTPGVPDFYQGSEQPLFSLTDPDNRRPVDFNAAAGLLEAQTSEPPGPSDGAAKQWLTHRLLHLRREREEAFADGANYRPLEVNGRYDEHVFAFARGRGIGSVVVVVPRLVLELVSHTGSIKSGALADTTVNLPAAGRWRNVLTGESYSGRDLAVNDLLVRFPVAVLVAGESGQ